MKKYGQMVALLTRKYMRASRAVRTSPQVLTLKSRFLQASLVLCIVACCELLIVGARLHGFAVQTAWYKPKSYSSK